MAFCYLLLGHLIGDFILQTNRIAVNKPIYRSWGIIHAVIVTLCMLIFAIPFGWKATLLVLPAGILHFLIDKTKSSFSEKNKMPELLAFIADQALHIAIIYIVSCFALKNILFLIFSRYQIIILLIFLFVTFFAAILNQYIWAIFFPRPGNFLFRKGEKTFGIIIRFTITLSIFLSFKYSILYFFIILAIPIILKIQSYFYEKNPIGKEEFILKLALDGLFSTLGSLMLLI